MVPVKTTQQKRQKKKAALPPPGKKRSFAQALAETHKQFRRAYEKLAK